MVPYALTTYNKYTYDHIREKDPDLVQINSNSSLLKDIIAADFVAGCQSMAMVIGLLAGKEVVCVIPPDGRECYLKKVF